MNFLSGLRKNFRDDDDDENEEKKRKTENEDEERNIASCYC